MRDSTDSALRELVADWRERADELGDARDPITLTHQLKLRDCANELEISILTAAGEAQREVAWACTDYDGHVGVGLTKEEAKRRAGESCNEYFPLYAAKPAPAGMVLVPRELTAEMYSAFNSHNGECVSFHIVQDMWDKMLYAAPTTPPPTLNEAFDQVGAAMIREVRGEGAAPAGIPDDQLDGEYKHPMTLRECMEAEEGAPAAQVAAQSALPMHLAPRDGRLLRLLVAFTDNAIEDSTDPVWTIGSNNTGDEDEWKFAGWSWEHDCYTQGEGTPVGWLPWDVVAPAAHVAVSEHSPVGLARCPITGRKFFENIEHPKLGLVATYGGPFDSYTIPKLCKPDDDLRSERYDHDAGGWVEGGVPVGYAYDQQQPEAAAPAVVVDEVQKDADRYRRLRNTRVNPYAVLPCGDALDAHVDALTAALKGDA